MLRAAVIWRVPALRMSDVSCPGPAEFGRISQFGPLWAQISARDRGKFASRIGPEGLAVVPDRAMPIVHPPALSTCLQAACSEPRPGHLCKRPFTNTLLNCNSAL